MTACPFMRNCGCMVRLAICVVVMSVQGCMASYVTPSRAADLSAFGYDDDVRQAMTDPSIQRALDRRPAAQFPTTIAIVRVQESGYRSHCVRSYGSGRYSVITQRDLETEEDLRTIRALPQVSDVVTVSSLLVPRSLNSDRELRAAAASVHADMLLIYTIDTMFTTDDALRPLSVLTLGLFPTKNVRVSTTASALLMDTRTGYIYGVAESTADRRQLANAWTDQDAADQSRRRTERQAFKQLIDRFQSAWREVIVHYDRRSPSVPLWPSG